MDTPAKEDDYDLELTSPSASTCGPPTARASSGVEDSELALATYHAACQRWPGTLITLRQGARGIEEGQPVPAHGAGRWRSQSLEPRRPWSGISRNACLMGCSCRTFREEHSPRPGCLPGGSPPSTL